MTRKQKIVLLALGSPVAASGFVSMTVHFVQAGYVGLALAFATLPFVVGCAAWKALKKDKEASHA